MKSKYLRLASIFEYVAAGIYAVITALFYSVSEKIFILFLILGVLSLCLGLYTESLIQKARKNQCNKIEMIVVTVLSTLGVVSLVFMVLALLDKKEEQPLVIDEVVKEPKTKKWYQKTCFIVAVASLAGIVATSVSGHLVETSGGAVVVKDGRLGKAESDAYIAGKPKLASTQTTDFALKDPTVSYSYTCYRPKNASDSNKLPVVFICPGFTRTKATMTQYAVEFSRRGAVAFTIDPGSQGSSTYAGYTTNSDGTKTQNGYASNYSGMGTLLSYVYNNTDEFNFIDRDKIGIIGHSAGGGDSTKLTAELSGATYEESIIKSIFISGYIKNSAINAFSKLRCNAVLSYGKYDEGSYRYQDEIESFEVAAATFIAKCYGNENSSVTANNFEIDHEYGDMANGTYRLVLHEDMNHCFDMYSPKAIKSATNFFRRTLSFNTSIKDGNQTWFGKEISNGLGLAFGFSLTIALLGVVVEFVPFMKSLKVAAAKREEDEKAAAYKYDVKRGEERVDRGIAKRLLFWLPMVLTAIIACLDFIPCARLGMDVFADAEGNIFTTNFPARMMNAVYLWALINGSIGILIWVLTTVGENLVYILMGKKDKVDWSKFKSLGCKPLDLLKSLGLALVLYGVFYGIIQLSYMSLHQDFRFMLISAAPLNKRMFLTCLMYIPGFYIFYFSNSLRVNLGIAREGFKEWQVLLIGALANSLGLVFILVINYWVYFKTGTVFYGAYSATDSSDMWLYVNMVFGLIVMMFILPIFNRLAYKKTGNIYSGALLWCMIFIMMSISASISHLPM
ncbi:MAG: hypothetical protein MJ248_05955 [Bacilli bacterium]|nr:hypothetical protein [Bacilli bacterium]